MLERLVRHRLSHGVRQPLSLTRQLPGAICHAMDQLLADYDKQRRAPWPDEIRVKARDLVVRLGWTISAAARFLKVPDDTMRCWAKDQRWLELKQKASERKLLKLEAELASPIKPVEAPSIEPAMVTTQSRINETLAQIDELDRALKEPDLTPRQRVELINAKATLWALVHPKAGTAKPSKRRGSAAYTMPIPEPEPA